MSTPAPVSSAIFRTSGSMRSTMIGASPKLISSTRSSFGSDARPRAIASICCSPPDSKPARRLSSGARTGNISSAFCIAAARRSRAPVRPSLRFSSTERSKNRDLSSATWATPRRAIFSGRSPLILDPNILIEPDTIVRMPETVSRVVVLPAPFGPSKATTSPAFTRKLSPRTTGIPP